MDGSNIIERTLLSEGRERAIVSSGVSKTRQNDLMADSEVGKSSVAKNVS